MKINFFTKLGFLSLIAVMGLNSASGLVYADSNSMTVTPTSQPMVLSPGEVYNGSIRISNASNSTRDLKYSVNIGSFNQFDDESSKGKYNLFDYETVSNFNQITKWIDLEKTSGTVAPGGSDTVGYSVTVPEDAAGGGQYATIMVVDETASDGVGNGNIAIEQKIQFASIIYAEVTGETRKDGEIISNTIPTFLLNGPFMAESMVKNDGNIHTNVEYTLQVWPLFSDEEICTNEEKPDISLVLPGTERYHAQACDKLPAVGIFKAKQIVKIFDKQSEVERVIIMCPMWLLFILLFVVIALVLWIFMIIQKRKKKSGDK